MVCSEASAQSLETHELLTVLVTRTNDRNYDDSIDRNAEYDGKELISTPFLITTPRAFSTHSSSTILSLALSNFFNTCLVS